MAGLYNNLMLICASLHSTVHFIYSNIAHGNIVSST